MSAILNIIARYARDLTIGEALDMASEIERVTAPEAIAPIVVPIGTLVTWLHGYDLSMNYGSRGHVNEHKIASIKALREAFRINGSVVGLKESKDAVDRYLATIGYIAF